jgi:hypothetical protein
VCLANTHRQGIYQGEPRGMVGFIAPSLRTVRYRINLEKPPSRSGKYRL